MTKKQLIKALKVFPDDTVIKLDIPEAPYPCDIVELDEGQVTEGDGLTKTLICLVPEDYSGW